MINAGVTTVCFKGFVLSKDKLSNIFMMLANKKINIPNICSSGIVANRSATERLHKPNPKVIFLAILI